MFITIKLNNNVINSDGNHTNITTTSSTTNYNNDDKDNGSNNDNNFINDCKLSAEYFQYFIVGFDHGLLCRVKNMAGGIQ